MTRLLFASDLHGDVQRYEALLARAEQELPDAVLLGGDLLPGGAAAGCVPHLGDAGFLAGWLGPRLAGLRDRLGAARAPRWYAIFGNDDPRIEEAAALDLAAQGLWVYLHRRRVPLGEGHLYGYACVPPSPFQLKDWECYDVSRYVDPGCVSPEDGQRTVAVPAHRVRWTTIAKELEELVGGDDLSRSVMLLHTPPYNTALDRAALDGQAIDWVPLDVHVGSIALRRLIEKRQPLLTLHGHIHEAPRITGRWRQRLGRTHMLTGAHDGPELALVRVDTDDPAGATRELL